MKNKEINNPVICCSNKFYGVKTVQVFAFVFLLATTFAFGQAGTTLKAFTAPPTLVSTTSATIGGTVSDAGTPSATTRWYQWGPDQHLWWNTTHVAATIPQTFSDALTGLIPNTTYYYTLCAVNASGVVVCGSTMQFKTLAAAPSVDLMITDMKWRDTYSTDSIFANAIVPVQPSNHEYGTDFQFTIKNVGVSSLISGNIAFSVYDGVVSSGTLLYKSGVGPVNIAPQGTKDAQFTMFIPKLRTTAHTYNFIIKIDSFEGLPEIDENNNTYSATLIVQ